MGWFITEVTFYGTVSELISLLWEMDVIDEGSIIDGGVKIIVPAGRNEPLVLKPKTLRGNRTKIRALGNRELWKQIYQVFESGGWCIELNEIDAGMYLIVKGWPAAEKEGIRQDDYCTAKGISAQTLRNWKKNFESRGFTFPDW